jgi:hypothetical protein
MSVERSGWGLMNVWGLVNAVEDRQSVENGLGDGHLEIARDAGPSSAHVHGHVNA